MTAARKHPGLRGEAGQAAVEYLVVAAGIVAALFFIDVDGKSLAVTLADTVRMFFRNLTYFISLP